MGSSLKMQSALLDAIYSAALKPDDYLAFTHVWDATIVRIAMQDGDGSLKLHAETLELRKHFNRAFEIFEKTRLGQRQDIQTFLDLQASAAAVCLEGGKLIACNGHFTTQFGLAMGDSLTGLAARLAPVHAATGTTVSPAGFAGPAVYWIDEPQAGHSMLVVDRLNEPGFAHANGEGLFLIRSNRIMWSERVAGFLHDQFGLTPTETDIARLLFLGKRSEDIAEIRKRKKGTVRQQIKAIMEKTEASTQVALITFLLSLHHLLAAKLPNTPSAKIHLNQPAQTHATVIAPSPLWGTIEFDRYGAPDGQPIAFFHSELSSAQPTPEMIAAMAENNLLVFAPRKPGLGATSLERQHADPQGFVAAFIALLADQGITCRALVGHGMSGVAVVDYAARNPLANLAIVTINTGVPYTRREQFDHFPPVPKRIFWTIWECPDLFYAPFAFAAETLFANAESERVFMKNQFNDMPHDSDLIVTPKYYDAAVRAMKDFMSTPKRSADELVYWMHDWTEALKDVAGRLPVLYLQSEHHHYLRREITADYIAPLPFARLAILRDVALLCVIENPHAIAREISTLINR